MQHIMDLYSSTSCQATSSRCRPIPSPSKAMGQRLHRMLAVLTTNEEKLFVQCSECDGFVKLSEVEYTDYEDAVCAHCHEDMVDRYWGPTSLGEPVDHGSGHSGPY
jgi:hypothetical protein